MPHSKAPAFLITWNEARVVILILVNIHCLFGGFPTSSLPPLPPSASSPVHGRERYLVRLYTGCMGETEG